MAVHETIHCVTCGWDVPPQRLGLGNSGAYDPAVAPAHGMSLRRTTIGGRGRCSVDRQPLPLPFAYGMRDALKAALARVNAEIAEAGGEPDVDE